MKVTPAKNWLPSFAKRSFVPILLLLPQDIMGLPEDRQLLFVKSAPPVVGEKVRYWDIAPWSEWAAANPMEGDHPRGGKAAVRLRYTRKGGRHE